MLGCQRFCEPQRRISEWLIAQIKGPPVHSNRLLAAGFLIGPDGFFGIEVQRLHEPARLVGTDRDHSEVDRAELPTDLLEMRTIA